MVSIVPYAWQYKIQQKYVAQTFKYAYSCSVAAMTKLGYFFPPENVRLEIEQTQNIFAAYA